MPSTKPSKASNSKQSESTDKVESKPVELTKPVETVADKPKKTTKARQNLATEDRGRLVSRVDHPSIITYGAEKIHLSARAQTQSDLIRGRIQWPLPSGVIFVKA